MKKEWTMPW